MSAAEAPIYVVLCSSDGVDSEDGPIVMETYTKRATLEQARGQAASMERRGGRYTYGPTRVARLVFEDVDGTPL